MPGGAPVRNHDDPPQFRQGAALQAPRFRRSISGQSRRIVAIVSMPLSPSARIRVSGVGLSEEVFQLLGLDIRVYAHGDGADLHRGKLRDDIFGTVGRPDREVLPLRDAELQSPPARRVTIRWSSR